MVTRSARLLARTVIWALSTAWLSAPAMGNPLGQEPLRL